jgi:Uma2 family endonuclease
MLERTVSITLDQWIRLYDQEGPFELVDGERYLMPPSVSKHGVNLKVLFTAFVHYEEETGAGEIFVEQPFVLTYETHWVKGSRVPDLMWFQADRLAAYQAADPAWEDKPFVIVPDLVIEIVSPTDSYAEVLDKVEGYLRDGVKIVWVVITDRKSVAIYKGEHYRVLSGDADLTATDLLPGFRLPLRDLFGA